MDKAQRANAVLEELRLRLVELTLAIETLELRVCKLNAEAARIEQVHTAMLATPTSETMARGMVLTVMQAQRLLYGVQRAIEDVNDHLSQTESRSKALSRGT